MGLHTLLHKKDSSILANDALKEIFNFNAFKSWGYVKFQVTHVIRGPNSNSPDYFNGEVLIVILLGMGAVDLL